MSIPVLCVSLDDVGEKEEEEEEKRAVGATEVTRPSNETSEGPPRRMS